MATPWPQSSAAPHNTAIPIGDSRNRAPDHDTLATSISPNTPAPLSYGNPRPEFSNVPHANVSQPPATNQPMLSGPLPILHQIHGSHASSQATQPTQATSLTSSSAPASVPPPVPFGYSTYQQGGQVPLHSMTYLPPSQGIDSSGTATRFKDPSQQPATSTGSQLSYALSASAPARSHSAFSPPMNAQLPSTENRVAQQHLPAAPLAQQQSLMQAPPPPGGAKTASMMGPYNAIPIPARPPVGVSGNHSPTMHSNGFATKNSATMQPSHSAPPGQQGFFPMATPPHPQPGFAASSLLAGPFAPQQPQAINTANVNTTDRHPAASQLDESGPVGTTTVSERLPAHTFTRNTVASPGEPTVPQIRDLRQQNFGDLPTPPLHVASPGEFPFPSQERHHSTASSTDSVVPARSSLADIMGANVPLDQRGPEPPKANGNKATRSSIPNIMSPVNQDSSDLPPGLALARLMYPKSPSDWDAHRGLNHQNGSAPEMLQGRSTEDNMSQKVSINPERAEPVAGPVIVQPSPAQVPANIMEIQRRATEIIARQRAAGEHSNASQHSVSGSTSTGGQGQAMLNGEAAKTGSGESVPAGLIPYTNLIPGPAAPVPGLRPRPLYTGPQKPQHRSWLQQNRLYQDRLYARGFRVLEGVNGTKVCSVCHHHFAKEMFVWRHALQHVGEKPFHCTVCDQRFTRSDTLQRHVRRAGHHSALQD